MRLRHTVATGGGSHDAITGTGKYERKAARETFGKEGSFRNFNIITTPGKIVV
jgi:hypothetical protein